MNKKISRKQLINNIIDYVFNTYCDDEQIVIFSQQYYEIEKILQEKRKSKSKDNNNKTYKITKEVRDFLEPLVDAEYFKSKYTNNAEEVLYNAMEQLQTKMHKELINTIQDKENKE